MVRRSTYPGEKVAATAAGKRKVSAFSPWYIQDCLLLLL